jgi:uncharacterized protein
VKADVGSNLQSGPDQRHGFQASTLLSVGSADASWRDNKGVSVASLLTRCGLAALVCLGWVGSSELLHGQQTQPRTGGDAPQRSAPGLGDEMVTFISKILASTEDVWRAKFQEHGSRYVDPKLVLFSGRTQTACGGGMAAMGPFYCPQDHKIYLDLDFFEELSRYGASGDFARAYVVAHEVGHHVQALLGIEKKVTDVQSKMSEVDANRLSVRLELQADCLAGIWASALGQLPGITLEPGDIEQGLRAAHALGDDMLQKQETGTVVLDAFTHGSGDQRARWFKRGVETAKIDQCNTFAASMVTRKRHDALCRTEISDRLDHYPLRNNSQQARGAVEKGRGT